MKARRKTERGASTAKTVAELKALNEKTAAILAEMQKSQSKAKSLMEIASMVITVLGILTIIDVVANWFN